MTKSKTALKIVQQIFITLSLISLASFSYGQNIRVAVASNFLSTANLLKPLFETEATEKGMPHTIQIVSASTGQLSHQILNGAPFDVFLSANKNHANIVKQTLNVSDQLFFKYAQGSLVLITNQALTTWPNITSSMQQVLVSENPVQTVSQALQTNIIQQVLESANKVAIANAKLAPYGLATQELLNNLNLFHVIKDKTVTGQNIVQTYQFFTSGSADAAFVARSHWLQTNQHASYVAKGSISIPTHLHNPIEQWGVIVNDSEASRAFQAFLLQPHIQTVMQHNGYGAVQ